MKKKDYKVEAEKAWNRLLDGKLDNSGTCLDNQIVNGITKDDKLIDDLCNAMKYSENQYFITNKGLYVSNFNPTMCFEDSKSAKLYDTLLEFFGDTKTDSQILTIIDMVQSYA